MNVAPSGSDAASPHSLGRAWPFIVRRGLCNGDAILSVCGADAIGSRPENQASTNSAQIVSIKYYVTIMVDESPMESLLPEWFVDG